MHPAVSSLDIPTPDIAACKRGARKIINMLTTRNARVVVSVAALVLVVFFLVTSLSTLSDGVKKAAAEVAYSEEENTLTGKPYQGSNPPYAQDDKAKKPKIIADKIGDKTKGAGGKAEGKPDVGRPGGSSGVGPGGKTGAGGYTGEKTGGSAGALSECGEEYVVMVDAGSTGLRVHIYRFDTCLSPPKLLHEEFKMLKPGLSSFDTDTVNAAKSLDPLLELAVQTVPKDKQGCTPVAVKATAGLRLLGKEKAGAILDEVRRHLEEDYPFAVVDGEGISIMDGKDEGVYAWITTNFLLGRIGGKQKEDTAAVLELGGGLAQIVFEPAFGDSETMVDGELKYELSFGGHLFTLYQFSHLGYGLMEGRNKVNSLVVRAALEGNKQLKSSKLSSKADAKAATAAVTLTNPCIPPLLQAENVVVSLADDEFYVVNMKGPSEPQGTQCRFLAESVLNKDAQCTTKPCSFNGVYQPSLVHTFHKTSDMYIFSYFYEKTVPLGFPRSFTVEELTGLAKTVCNGDPLWTELLAPGPVGELNKEPQWCLDISFITALLHTGYDIPLSRELRTAEKIDNNEIGWCLGASLPLLDKGLGKWKCRVAKA